VTNGLFFCLKTKISEINLQFEADEINILPFEESTKFRTIFIKACLFEAGQAQT
jgi:hypothetical protein